VHDRSDHSPKLPKFEIDFDPANEDNLRLPEEQKRYSENPITSFKIDFANDPVTRSLLEAKQDQFDLFLQRLYLSKRCKFLYIILAFT
jgi:hypothetical protein